jgi:hypothetical protein
MSQTHHPRHVLRSVAVIFAGLLTMVVLSIATDAAMYATRVFPAGGRAMPDALWLLPTGYRFAFGVLGCWLTARLAPKHPMRHALGLGCIGLVLGMLGLIAALNADPPLGPTWYAVAVMALSVPTALIGGWFGGTFRLKPEAC